MRMGKPPRTKPKKSNRPMLAGLFILAVGVFLMGSYAPSLCAQLVYPWWLPGRVIESVLLVVGLSLVVVGCVQLVSCTVRGESIKTRHQGGKVRAIDSKSNPD